MNATRFFTSSFFTALLWFSANHSGFGFTGTYAIQNFSPKDYKAGIQNIDFAQNRNMTLFVANNLGVLSFNGVEWRRHAYKTGKKKRSLAFDDNTNRLYSGAQGEFGYFERDWQYISLVDKIPAAYRDFDEVWDVFLNSSRVYFCTFKAIYVYDGQAIEVIHHQDGFDRSFHSSGKLFTQTSKGKLLEIQGLDLIPMPIEHRAGQIISGIIPENNSYLLFYNSGKIQLYSIFGSSFNYGMLIDALQDKYVNHVTQLSDTRLAIATQTSGIFLYDPQTRELENITTKDGLRSNACLRTFQDYTGNLWVGMQNGLALININSPIRLINKKIDLQGSGYDAFQTSNGIYYTTSNGIYFLPTGATKCRFLSGTEGPSYSMQKIAGKLYAAHHSGVFLLEGEKATQIAVTEGMWKIEQLRSNPRYAIGGTYAGLYLFEIDRNDRLKPVQRIRGFEESSRFFKEDQKGRIWVGQFYKGLYRLKLNAAMTSAEVSRASESYDFPFDDQISLSIINDELHFATKSGIYRLDQMTEQIVRAELFEEEVGQRPVYLLKQDRQNNIHIYAEGLVGFYRQISSSNYVFLPSSLFQFRYSLNNDLLNIALNIKEGVLFNSNEGFIQYNPEEEDRMVVKSPFLVDRLYSVLEGKTLYHRTAFEEPQQEQVRLSLKAGKKVLQFHIESFEFQNTNNMQFSYYLEGFDKNYSEWTTATTKEYTNLREGNYQFRIKGQNYLGQIIESQPIALKIHPPFHRSLFAIFLYIFLGVLLLFLISKTQNQRYKKKAQQINTDRQVELAEKQRRLREIEEQKERELEELKEEKVQSELRHLNNLLAASTMNLVVKNEFIESIKEKLDQVKKKGVNKEIRQAINQLIKEIDVTLNIQDDWEQFTHHFDQVHGDFSTRLKEAFTELTPNELKLCTFLRLNLNTKEIANLMGISHRGVEVARYRLRKKLGLEKGQNLSKFILEY